MYLSLKEYDCGCKLCVDVNDDASFIYEYTVKCDSCANKESDDECGQLVAEPRSEDEEQHASRVSSVSWFRGLFW